MPLVELATGTQDWYDIAYAALVLHKCSQLLDTTALRDDLRGMWPTSSITDLHTGINQGRKAVISSNHDTIVIALQGSGADEWMMNMWTHGKAPNWWDIPYAVHVDRNQVHSFYLDMWNGMKDTCLSTLSDAINKMQEQGIMPSRVIVTGYSMGGGVSTLAFRDILSHINNTYGNPSSSPQTWALDHNLRHLIQHLTFASIGAGDIGFLTKLNELYCQYHIRAWDFLDH